MFIWVVFEWFLFAHNLNITIREINLMADVTSCTSWSYRIATYCIFDTMFRFI